MPRKLTHEEAVNRIKEINPNIKVLSEYIGSAKPLRVQCTIDNHEWTTTYSNIVCYKRGCPKCAQNAPYTQEEFVAKMLEIHPNIEVIGTYTNANKKVRLKCKIDGFEWEATPNSLFSLQCGCPKCAGNAKYTTKSFIQAMKKISPNIEIKGEYKDNKTKIACKCKICGWEWEATPNNLLRKRNCPKCNHAVTMTNEEFLEKLKKVNSFVEPQEIYINYDTKIKIKCLKCGHTWFAKPDNLLQGRGCPKCRLSTGEKIINGILTNFKIDYERQKWYEDCRDELPLPFDFYISQYNLLIEYQGHQHYYPVHFGGISNERAVKNLEVTQKHDKIKAEYCLKNDINLLTITFWEKDNIERILALKLNELDLSLKLLVPEEKIMTPSNLKYKQQYGDTENK